MIDYKELAAARDRLLKVEDRVRRTINLGSVVDARNTLEWEPRILHEIVADISKHINEHINEEGV